MPAARSISELLIRWEDLHAQGRVVSAEELCGEQTELVEELKSQIVALRAMNKLLASTPGPLPTNETEPAAGLPEWLLSEFQVTTQSSYRVLRPHARGGLGEVLIARDQSLGREVAIKVMLSPQELDPERRRRFEAEAAITSVLEHPGIVPVYGLGKDDQGRPYYTMRFIDGMTLRDGARAFHAAENSSADPAARNLRFRSLLDDFVTVCNTIAYAHSRGVIHRDLKPANIMLGKYGETLVVDWGLAKRFSLNPYVTSDPSEITIDRFNAAANIALDVDSISTDDLYATQSGQTLGTPAYMSPEQAAGESRRVGPASDIYGLGATLYMVLTGRSPYDGYSIPEIFERLQCGTFPLPRTLKPYIPRALQAICLKAMSHDPSLRYPTATQLATDLKHWLAGEPVSAFREPLVDRTRRWLFKHRQILSAVVVAGVMAIIGLAAVLFVTSQSNRDLRAANDRERIATADAQANSRVAREQGDLALATLRSVTDDIQKQLKNIAAAHPVRRSLQPRDTPSSGVL